LCTPLWSAKLSNSLKQWKFSCDYMGPRLVKQRRCGPILAQLWNRIYQLIRLGAVILSSLKNVEMRATFTQYGCLPTLFFGSWLVLKPDKSRCSWTWIRTNEDTARSLAAAAANHTWIYFVTELVVNKICVAHLKVYKVERALLTEPGK
jgi:hypothetical protein